MGNPSVVYNTFYMSIFLLFCSILLVWFSISQGNKNKEQRIGTALNSKKDNDVIEYPKFLGLSLIIIVIAFNVFMYGTLNSFRMPSLAFGLYNFFIVSAVILVIKKSKHSLVTFALSIVSIFCGLFLSIRANGFVQSVNIITMTVSMLMLYFINTYDAITWKGLWFVKNFPNLLPLTLTQIPALIQRPKTNDSGKNINFAAVFKTFLITTATVVFFVGLLSSADPVFASLIKDFKDEVIGRVIASLFIIALAIVFLTQKARSDKENYWKLGFLSFSDLFIPAVALVALFSAFLVVQASYLFGSEMNLEKFQLTYSEYVRKGFIELLVTAFFGGILSYFIIMKSRLSVLNKHIHQFKFVNSILIFELLLMLGSALKRDLMYVEAYGLTRVRIIGGLFLFWLAGLLALLLILNLYKSFKERKFIGGIAVLSVIVVSCLNIFNIDQMVVNGSPQHHDYQDYFYINNLSEDGYKGWREAITSISKRTEVLINKDNLTDEEKSQLAGDKLALISLQQKRVKVVQKFASEQWLCENLHDGIDCLDGKIIESYSQNRDWRHFNFAEKRAYDEIINNQNLYSVEVDRILKSIRDYQIKNALSLEEQERWFINEFKYPFININLNYYPERLEDLTKEDIFTRSGYFGDKY